jgi:tetratricopeptide (TPR) repeat protein
MSAGTGALLRSHLLRANGLDAEADAALRAAGDAAASDDPLARLVAANVARQQGDLEQAERDLLVALSRVAPDSPLRHAVQVALLEVHLAEERHADALDDVHALQGLGDGRSELAAIEAWLWRRLGKASEARARAETLIERVVHGEDEAIAVAYTWEGKRAFDWLDLLTAKALERHSGSGTLWVLRASALSGTHRLADALEAHGRAAALVPDVGWAEARRSQVLSALGRHPDALAAAERAVALDPNDEESQRKRSCVCRQAGRADLAVTAARRAVELADSIENRLELACALAADGDLGQADRHVAGILLHAKGHPDVLAVLAWIRSQQGLWAEAEAAARAALDVVPDRIDLHHLRGNALRKLGRGAEAVEAYRAALAIRADYPQATYGLGLSLLESGNAEAALEVVRPLALAHRENAAVVNLHGTVLKALERLPEALEECRRALELAPDDADFAANVAAIHTDLGEHDAALRVFDDVVARQPGDAVNHTNRAVARANAGDVDGALADFAEAERLDPSGADAPSKAGLLLLRLGHHEEALDRLEVAALRAPRDAPIQLHVAAALAGLGLLDRAEAAAKRAIDLDASYALGWSALGGVLGQQGDAAGAAAAYDEARRLDPKDPALALAAGLAYVQLGQPGRAADVLTEAAGRFRRHAAIRGLLAWILVQANDATVRSPAKAAVYAREAADLDPDDGRIWLALGAALVRTDRESEAVVKLEEARRHDEPVEPAASFFLAMALQRLGRPIEARAAFDRGASLRRTLDPDEPEKVALEREAAEVLGLPPP